MRVLENISPERVFFYFEEISRIPRGSGNEEAIAVYIENFAKEKGLFAVRDNNNNVFVKMPASAGYEKAPAVLLQGHTDMVCEKNEDTSFDFLSDPIKLVLDGDILSADGTTLGADDGVAVAMMLALLEDKNAVHGPLECLFTTEEETGLGGMKAFDKSQIGADFMINLDSEDDDTAVISCAGGFRTDFVFSEIPFEKCNNEITLSVKGLMGGHSGADIHLGRANANKIAFQLLSGVEDVRLISVNGGSKDNAIPRECTIVFTSDEPMEVPDIVAENAEEIKASLCGDDAAFSVECNYKRCQSHCFAEKYSRSIITLVNSLPYGVIDMSSSVEGLVESSSNPGVIKTEGSTVTVVSSSRSSVESRLDAIQGSLDSLADFVKVSSVTHRDRYPGWDVTENSLLQKKYKEIYKKLHDTEPKILGIHAGLECGLIKSAVPEIDIISIGPNARNIHTPDETLSVSSVNKLYTILLELLKELK